MIVKQCMCRIMEELFNDERISIALNLLRLNEDSFEKIAKVTGLSVEKVRELSETLKPKTA